VSQSYPGDAQDALFIDDGPAPWWWMSPDIWIGTPGGTVAYQGPNEFFVKVHMTAGKTFAASQARCDLYIGNPSLVMTPTAGTVLVGQNLVPKAELTNNGTVTTKFTRTLTVDTANPSNPDQPGHRCLIARVYPFGTARPNVFDVPNEQHEAQLNVTIASTSKEGAAMGGAGAGMGGAGNGGEGQMGGPPIGPGPDGMWGFLVDTTTVGDEAEEVVIRATQATELSKPELRVLLRALGNRQFEAFVEDELHFDLSFELEREFLPAVRYVQNEGEWCEIDVEAVPADPFIPDVKQLGQGEFALVLEPQRIARFALKADMSGVAPGQAAVFHINQHSVHGDVQGGLTLVMLGT
jgi:hypothetical protein